mgnify:CR=1 FL=1
MSENIEPIYDGLNEFLSAVENGDIDPNTVSIRIQSEQIIGEICNEDNMYLEHTDSIYEEDDIVYFQEVFRESGKPYKIVEKFFTRLNINSFVRKIR